MLVRTDLFARCLGKRCHTRLGRIVRNARKKSATAPAVQHSCGAPKRKLEKAFPVSFATNVPYILRANLWLLPRTLFSAAGRRLLLDLAVLFLEEVCRPQKSRLSAVIHRPGY